MKDHKADLEGVKAPINLSRGWPSPDLHPNAALLEAAQHVLTTPSISVPGLQYGPDPGYEPLRKNISKWLSQFYSTGDDSERITISGGASQNLACALQVFSDPNVTKRIWMVAPCYYLASGIFRDAGFDGRLRAVPEGNDGIDLEYLEAEMEKLKDDEPRGPVSYENALFCLPLKTNEEAVTCTLFAVETLESTMASQHTAEPSSSSTTNLEHYANMI